MARSTQQQQPEKPVDVLADIEAELAVEEVEWAPESAGELVAGFVDSIDYKELASGRVLPILTLTTKDGGRVKVAAGRKVLSGELERKKVQPGDAIGIEYEGTRKTAEGGAEYHSYRVVVRPQGPRKPSEAFVADKKPDLGLVADAGSSWGQEPDDDEPAF